MRVQPMHPPSAARERSEIQADMAAYMYSEDMLPLLTILLQVGQQNERANDEGTTRQLQRCLATDF